MNKKFLSTLLTTLTFTNFNLNAATVTRTRVVEVERKLPNMVNLKISPTGIMSGNAGIEIELGVHKNFSMDINVGTSIKDYFKDFLKSNKVGLHLNYYSNENRRNGLFVSIGPKFHLVFDDKFSIINTLKNISINTRFGYKMEVSNYIYISSHAEYGLHFDDVTSEAKVSFFDIGISL